MTERVNQYGGKCVNCQQWIEPGAGHLVAKVPSGWGVKHPAACPPVSIPATVGAPVSVSSAVGAHAGRSTAPTAAHGAPGTAPAPTARHDSWPERDLDLRSLDAGCYGVPGTDDETRLKVRIDKPDKGKWVGWIFVKDAAVYGEGRRYGSQAPGQLYRGMIPNELTAIVADPIGGFAKYGKLTGRCGICGRPLEDAESVARGIGPVCYGRLTSRS